MLKEKERDGERMLSAFLEFPIGATCSGARHSPSGANLSGRL